jgi:hypothetical protein
MIDKAIKSNDILHIVAVHDGLSGREAFDHSHWARPSGRRRQQEQGQPDRGTLNVFSHGLSRTPVAAFMIEAIDGGYKVDHMRRFRAVGGDRYHLRYYNV